MEKHLYIKNEYGRVQLTDEQSSYFFLKEDIPLSNYYLSTSSMCSCTWNDGTVTTEAYNYCVRHAIDAKLVFVVRNPSDTPVRLAVMPLDFTGAPSFHICVTGCTRAQADALRVYVFSGHTEEFTDSKYGMAFYDRSGKPLYNSGWKPLKITSSEKSTGAWNKEFTFNANCGVILNSGYRLAEGSIETGVWTYTSSSSSADVSSNWVPDATGLPTFSPPISIGGYAPGGNNNYNSSGQTINIFPTQITYQGYVLSRTSLKAQTYVAKAPIATTSFTNRWSDTRQEYTPVQRWDPCAYETLVWDNCADQSYVWDNCADKDFFTGECKPGMKWECRGGFVTHCDPGWKTEFEWVTVTTDYTQTTVATAPYMDQPSLMYGMEAYPDGTLFIRTSGISTVGIVDLANYI